MPQSPTNLTGPPVKGHDFFDRKEIVAQIWERLEEGNNLLLLAPRRVGKSSLMFRLASEATSHGFQPLMVSVASAESETEFLRELIRALNDLNDSDVNRVLKGIAQRGKWLRRIKKFAILGVGWEVSELGDDWKDAGEDLRLGLTKLSDRWLVLIDELPVFVHRLITNHESAELAGVFLDWLRDLRIAKNAPENVRWFLSGSIGLDTVTRQANLGDKINDLHQETRLGAFDDKVARAFLNALGQRYQLGLSDEVAGEILHRTGWAIPYHLQLLFSEIRDVATRGEAPTRETVDAAYEQLLSPRKRSHFDFWVQRLTKELPTPLNSHSLLLLDAVARDPDGASPDVLKQTLGKQVTDPAERDSQFEFLLQVLQTDGYLIFEDNRYHFRSVMLCDFWKRRRLP